MLYDYECEKCGHEMNDVKQSIKDDALTKCPECKKNTLTRIIYGGTYASVKKEPTTIGQIAERRFEEGVPTMPDGRPIQKIHWNKTDMVERAEKRAHDKKARRDKNTAKQQKINKISKMTPEQKRNYIQNGD